MVKKFLKNGKPAPLVIEEWEAVDKALARAAFYAAAFAAGLVAGYFGVNIIDVLI